MKLRHIVATLGTVFICSADAAPPVHAEEEPPSTPSWTFPDAFLREEETGEAFAWPTPRTEARPGACWWWPGSAVTKEDLWRVIWRVR